MIQILIVAIIVLTTIFLLYYKLIQIDLSFPWLLSLVILAFIGINNNAVVKLASIFKIYNEPLVIVFLTFFITFGLVTVLLIGYTNIRIKQIKIIKKIALIELNAQVKEKYKRL
jgi:uncharacterized integral membrane protein